MEVAIVLTENNRLINTIQKGGRGVLNQLSHSVLLVVRLLIGQSSSCNICFYTKIFKVHIKTDE